MIFYYSHCLSSHSVNIMVVVVGKLEEVFLTLQTQTYLKRTIPTGRSLLTQVTKQEQRLRESFQSIKDKQGMNSTLTQRQFLGYTLHITPYLINAHGNLQTYPMLRMIGILRRATVQSKRMSLLMRVTGMSVVTRLSKTMLVVPSKPQCSMVNENKTKFPHRYIEVK